MFSYGLHVVHPNAVLKFTLFLLEIIACWLGFLDGQLYVGEVYFLAINGFCKSLGDGSFNYSADMKVILFQECGEKVRV